MIISKSCRTVVAKVVTRDEEHLLEEHLVDVNFSVAERRLDLIVMTLAVSWLKNKNSLYFSSHILPCEVLVFGLGGEKR
jgi:hypothetical protein